MVRQDSAAGAQATGCARCGASGPAGANPELLVAALEQALLATHRLRDALDAAARHHAEVTAQLEQALVLVGSCSARDRRARRMPDCSGRSRLMLRARPEGAAPADAHRAGQGAGRVPPAAPTSNELSRREAEVLRLLAAGHSTRQIAQALFLSPRTVQRHVANAYLKIGAHNRAEAVAYALRHGLR